jgi:hypothetical protein
MNIPTPALAPEQADRIIALALCYARHTARKEYSLAERCLAELRLIAEPVLRAMEER